ncbi:MAG TPA: hypothetical protein PKY77_08095 [Phycisphaerae bacterium]|nr:hypothetical protein [Phycisphaerae bacterium]HRY68653.1 hypothetical protein [Phycisphaerae bacterium]HSA25479.1 hypothetical protein [Phycisphaerae bacterium]
MIEGLSQHRDTQDADQVADLSAGDGSETQGELILKRSGYKWLCEVLFLGGMLLCAVIDVLSLGEGERLCRVVGAITGGVTSLAWGVIDAREQGRRLSLAARILVLLTGPLGLVLYLSLRRRWKPLLRILAVYVVTMVACLAVYSSVELPEG